MAKWIILIRNSKIKQITFKDFRKLIWNLALKWQISKFIRNLNKFTKDSKENGTGPNNSSMYSRFMTQDIDYERKAHYDNF